MMRVRQALLLFCTAAIALLSASCADEQTYLLTPVHSPASSPISSLATNTTSFSFSHDALYTIHMTTPLSKLRHGHQEFTVNLANADRALVIAFIGYTGPASYTLSNRTNGGDVRISIGEQYWDLSLIPTASCSLTILSDNPTAQAGLHRMQGRFSCPTLPPGELVKPAHAVTITDGTFDVLIIVES